MEKKYGLKRRSNTRTVIFLMATLTALVSCNNDKNSGTIKQNSDTASQAGGTGVGDPAKLQPVYLHTVELMKADYDTIVRNLPGEGPGKKKLIIQFSTSNIADRKAFFDLAIYAALNHNDYAANKTRFIAKAANPSLQIQNGQNYILGNNEISLKQINQAVQNRSWNKIIFYPEINQHNQIRYLLLPFFDGLNFDENKLLDSIKGLDEKSKAIFYTNPSPPAPPEGL